MNIPDNYRYSREHTWLKVEGETALVGITEFAQGELGEIVYVDLPNVGLRYEKDSIFGSVEAVKTTSDLYMPVGGEILEVNKTLLRSPGLVNTEPFDSGWMIRIRVTDEAEIEAILTSEGYRAVVS